MRDREGSSFIAGIYFLFQHIDFLYVVVFHVYKYLVMEFCDSKLQIAT